MKFTEDLKDKLEGAKTAEESNKIIVETKKAVEDAGVILDDEELDKAAGGKHPRYWGKNDDVFI